MPLKSKHLRGHGKRVTSQEQPGLHCGTLVQNSSVMWCDGGGIRSSRGVRLSRAAWGIRDPEKEGRSVLDFFISFYFFKD